MVVIPGAGYRAHDFNCNNIHKKLLDSDWLRALQFKCNASAKSVTLVILDYGTLKKKSKFSKPMISRKMMAKILCGNSETFFLE